MRTTTKKIPLETLIRELLTGWTTDIPADVVDVTFGGQTYTSVEIVQKLTAILAVFQAASQAETDFHQQVIARKAQLKSWRSFREDLVIYLKNRFGKDGAELPRFGITKKIPAKPSTDTNAIAKVKRLATRKLHGIQGPKQRAETVVGGKPTVVVLGPDGKPLIPGGGSGTNNGGAK